MGWGNIYKRRMKVFTLTFLIYLDYKALQQREKLTRKSKRDGLWEKAHERNAKRVLKLIVELEGLWVKMGQYLSTRADVLPEAYIRLLRQLQDSLPPRDLEEVCSTIEKQLGKSMNDLFSNFVSVPLATASIAQVHRATLHDGQEVVVKVQHEGIKTIILEDLKNAKSIVDWIAWAEPQYDFNPMIDEWIREAPKELDFNHEAENTRKVSRNLGCKSEGHDKKPDHVDVLIPKVIQSTEKVLVLEYMDGVRLNDSRALEELGVDKQKLVEEITRAYAHQIYVDGFFNGDPHPGNFLVSREPPHRPVLLDFGLTKLLSSSVKHALAKMFLAAAEGDHVALLSAFAEMGLKLRLDMPEQAMEITNVFFRATTPATEALETVKNLSEQRQKNMKIIQEKMKLNKKEVKRFNPIDAFPGDIVIFSRVLNLLRGLSSSMNVRISYLNIMRPFAESVLKSDMNHGPSSNPKWVYDGPVHSDVETKLRQFLVDLGNADRILGIQVCAYKDGKVIIDTAAGVLGKYDPRPVQPDSLFPVFSVSKGVTAGMVHWLVDKGKLKLDENVANVWPEFGTNGKDQIKVNHILNHTSGLHNALANISEEDPMLFCDWDECLKRIAMVAPETEPGREQLYHYLSYGWLCGGVIEHASGKKFQDVLEEAFVRPLNIEGELYIGIPPGVESRLATLTIDMNDLTRSAPKLDATRSSAISNALPSSFTFESISSFIPLSNTLNVRRAILPAANGHFSARALARYYAALVDGGVVPPHHSSSSLPPLGSHPHRPMFPSKKTSINRKDRRKKDSSGSTSPDSDVYIRIPNTEDTSDEVDTKIFTNTKTKLHDAFMGSGDFEDLIFPGGRFGLGFRRVRTADGSVIGFGHSGLGGSTAYCDIHNRFAITVTLNKLSFGALTGEIIRFVCSELDVPVPEEYAGSRFAETPVIN
ncbi:putative ABC-type Cd(2+) transporter [Helianthus annuus]|nr:putative ABC-type Cd(2+) transporter [Helianthus annuus]KAJ0608991.1 putative ABC-type Cd(2+) transporter [Helianthus annuus]